MVSTVKITASMFPDVYEGILREWNPRLSRGEWQQAFVARWQNDADHFGYALTDGGRILGMLGMLFSQRPAAGRLVPFCNLHCWHVKHQYRAHSLALLKPVLSLKDHVVTDFTPSPAVIAIAQRLGFQMLDASVLILPRLPSHGGRAGAAVCEPRGPDDPQATAMELNDQQIYRDHQCLGCTHLLARHGNEYCYVVSSRIERHALPYSLIHYVSNPRVFAAAHAAIRAHLVRRDRTRYVVVESRLLGGVRVPWSLRAGAHPKMYRGIAVGPGHIDTLYSEMVLYKHSPLPGLRARLRSTAKRCIPAPVRQLVGVTLAP